MLLRHADAAASHDIFADAASPAPIRRYADAAAAAAGHARREFTSMVSCHIRYHNTNTVVARRHAVYFTPCPPPDCRFFALRHFTSFLLAAMPPPAVCRPRHLSPPAAVTSSACRCRYAFFSPPLMLLPPSCRCYIIFHMPRRCFAVVDTCRHAALQRHVVERYCCAPAAATLRQRDEQRDNKALLNEEHDECYCFTLRVTRQRAMPRIDGKRMPGAQRRVDDATLRYARSDG